MEKLKLFLIKACLYVGGFLAFQHFVDDRMEKRFENSYFATEAKQKKYCNYNLVTKTETTPYSPAKKTSSKEHGGFSNISSNSRNIGSARSVKHKLYILTLYVTQDKDPLTPEEKQYYNNSLCIAKDWLVETAALYGIDFDIGIYHVCHDDGSEFHLDDSYATDKMEPRKIAKMYYGQNYLSKIRGFAQKAGYDDYIFIVCYKNNSNICRAYKADESQNNNSEYLEGCIINLNTTSELPTAIAHEILHTLGAWDLYVNDKNNYNIYKGDGARYSKMTKGSIMRNTHRPINSTKMDALTAYLVGLSDTRFDWFDILSENGGF